MKARKVTTRDKQRMGIIPRTTVLCHILRRDGQLCERHATAYINRADGSFYAVCTPHLNGLRAQWEKMPSAYPSVTVERIS